MTPPLPVRILIVDDHQVVRVGLRALLSHYPDLQILGEAATVEAACTEAARTLPDVILMDVRLPDGTGFDACRRIRQSSPSIRVLFLTSFTDDRTLVECVMAGAHGYLLKEVDEGSLVNGIRTVAAGQSILDPAVTGTLLDRLKGDATKPPDLERLSPQEQRVLALVAAGKTNKEIGVELDLSEKTVKNYLSNLMEKLGISRRAHAAALYASQKAPSGQPTTNSLPPGETR